MQKGLLMSIIETLLLDTKSQAPKQKNTAKNGDFLSELIKSDSPKKTAELLKSLNISKDDLKSLNIDPKTLSAVVSEMEKNENDENILKQLIDKEMSNDELEKSITQKLTAGLDKTDKTLHTKQSAVDQQISKEQTTADQQIDKIIALIKEGKSKDEILKELKNADRQNIDSKKTVPVDQQFSKNQTTVDQQTKLNLADNQTSKKETNVDQQTKKIINLVNESKSKDEILKELKNANQQKKTTNILPNDVQQKNEISDQQTKLNTADQQISENETTLNQQIDKIIALIKEGKPKDEILKELKKADQQNVEFKKTAEISDQQTKLNTVDQQISENETTVDQQRGKIINLVNEGKPKDEILKELKKADQQISKDQTTVDQQINKIIGLVNEGKSKGEILKELKNADWHKKTDSLLDAVQDKNKISDQQTKVDNVDQQISKNQTESDQQIDKIIALIKEGKSKDEILKELKNADQHKKTDSLLDAVQDKNKISDQQIKADIIDQQNVQEQNSVDQQIDKIIALIKEGKSKDEILKEIHSNSQNANQQAGQNIAGHINIADLIKQKPKDKTDNKNTVSMSQANNGVLNSILTQAPVQNRPVTDKDSMLMPSSAVDEKFQKITELTKKMITSKHSNSLTKEDMTELKNITNFKSLIEFANKKGLNISKMVLSKESKTLSETSFPKPKIEFTNIHTTPIKQKKNTLNNLLNPKNSETQQPAVSNIQTDIKHDIIKAKQSIKHFANNLKSAIDNYKPPVSKLSMELNPKELGKVEVTITHRGDNLQIQINSSHSTTAFLHSQQQILRENLVNMGFSDVNMSFNSNQQNKKESRQNQKIVKNEDDKNDTNINEIVIELKQYA